MTTSQAIPDPNLPDAAWLRSHGYDGLYCLAGDACGCALNNLAPCREQSEECEPGIKQECNCIPKQCSFHIGPRPKEVKEKVTR